MRRIGGHLGIGEVLNIVVIGRQHGCKDGNSDQEHQPTAGNEPHGPAKRLAQGRKPSHHVRLALARGSINA